MRSRILLCTVLLSGVLPDDLTPQELTLPLEHGTAVVTCFAGTVSQQSDITINPDGYVLGVVDVRNPPPEAFSAPQWEPPMYHHPDWTARNLGQIFGLTLDEEGNIYVTASAMYGLPDDLTATGIFGPGGPGAVYRIDGMTGEIALFALLPNTGAGLGNICYDLPRRQFYITNLEDGRIYRLRTDGSVLDSFDPFARDNGRPGIAPLGERLWGIDVRDDRIYYAVWNEDWRDAPDPSDDNEIWSVALDLSGKFLPATNRPELVIESAEKRVNRSAVITDIIFGPGGRMLVVESTFFTNIGLTEYYGRLFEYRNDAGGWSLPKRIHVGTARGMTNAQGGADYGGEISLSVDPEPCAGSIWVTGNPIFFDNVANAGISGIPIQGNTPENVGATSISIDVDGILEEEIYTKSLMGDLDIYKVTRTRDTVRTCSGTPIMLEAGGVFREWSSVDPTITISCPSCRTITVDGIAADYQATVIDAEGCITIGYYHVEILPTLRIDASIGSYGPYRFQDTFTAAVYLDNLPKGFGVDTVTLAMDYDRWLMRPIGITPDSVGEAFRETLLEDWIVTEARDDQQGMFEVTLAAPPGIFLNDTGTLAKFRYATFLIIDLRTANDSVGIIPLPFSLELSGIPCAGITEEPGDVSLGICGLRYRLIEAVSGKYSLTPITTGTPGLDRIEFSLPLDGPTRLDMYNSLGEHVRTLVDDDLLPGEYDMTWKTGLPPGVYFYRLMSGDYVAVRKVVVY